MESTLLQYLLVGEIRSGFFENCFCAALDLKVKSCLSKHGNIGVVWVGATAAHCLRTGRVTYIN